MALADITTTGWILVLFKRDDGETLLLGDGHYSFNENQKHFQPNKFANDVLELQGTDGQLLTGQVRRSQAQTFDGFVGDATTNRETVEQLRRAFFLFFRKKHRYTAVYIFPNGTAIKRDRGYIVDAPEVQELYQIIPTYHIALAFEDVNYYSYREDDQGNEIFAFSAELGLSNIADGGLIWDANGAISSVQSRTLTRIDGDTFQQTYTGKNLAQPLDKYTYNRNGSATIESQSDGTVVFKTSSSSVSSGVYIYKTNGDNATLCPELFTAGYTVSFDVEATDTCTFEFGVTGNHTTTTVSTTKQRVSVATATGAGMVFYNNSQNGATITISNIQVEAGSTASDYEPFVGGTPSPNPDYPQAIQTVTGEQTVTINSTAYPISLGTIELCKLGTYQDYIWKDGEDWKIHRATGKNTADVLVHALNGTTSGPTRTSSDGAFFIYNSAFSGAKTALMSTNLGIYKLDANVTVNAAANAMTDGTFCQRQGTNDRLYFRNTAYIGKTGDEVKALLLSKSGGSNVYYSLATPTDTIITNAALIAQLNALEAAMATDGAPSNIASVSPNLPAILEATPGDQGGYIFAPSTGGGPVYVTVDGVDSAYPVWHVMGPAANPTLTNSTTGESLTWNGTIPNGQELIIDCGAQTATMEGANVFEFISGSWIELAPGVNRITYTAANTTKPCTIYWNEIVG